MFYVYVLRSKRDGKYYIGQTESLSRRLVRHNLGLVVSTKKRRPFILVGYKEFKTRNEARWMEYSLKNHGDKKKRFIEEMASGS